MKGRRVSALFVIVLLSIVTTTVFSVTAISFTNESGISASKQSKEVFLDPYLQEVSSTEPIEVSERLIIVFDPTVNMDLRRELLSTIDDLEVIQAYRIIPGVCVKAPLSAIESIKKLDGVEAVWFDHEVKALNNSKQIFLRHKVSPELSDSVGLINAPSLWALGINGSGIVIAVVDTGVNWYHESLDDLDDDPATVDPKVIADASFVPGVPTGLDDHGHGTHVAGIAAGTGGPSHIYMGVAPGAQLYAVKVLDSTGMGYGSWVVAGIEWSVENGADVITMSLGGLGYPYDPVCMASDAAVDAGVVVTVAAGNWGEYGYGTIDSPGLATKVITVGATTKGDTMATFSSRGPNTYDYRGDPDIVAPGVGIMSADAWDITGYVPMSGTSMATPHVAGGAALLLQAFDGVTPKLVTSALMASAVDLGYDSYTQGAGRIDVSGAYDLINESIEQGFLQLEATYHVDSLRANREEVTPRYVLFGNARIQFVVDDFGNVLSLYFDGRDQLAVMGWRIAYNTSNLASWLDLEIVQPMTMRVWNATYQQAFGAFRTPDKAAAVFVMVELFGNETWARTSFMVWPMDATLENLRIFYIEDVGMYMDYENDWSHYYSSQDITVVNDTYEHAPAQHLGFGGGLPSSAHHVGEWPSAWEAAYYDRLNNETEWIGDDNNAFRWSQGSVSTLTTVSVIFGLEYNVSAVFSVINEGRATPPTPFNIIPYPELSVSISGPTIATPDTTTYTATVSNYWLGDSVGAMLTFYLDDSVVDFRVIGVLSGTSIEVPINISMSKGVHLVKAEVFDPNDPVLRNNIARKRVFAGIIFSAVLPCELEVNTYTDFGPFSSIWMAWVNLTIITPNLMPDVEIRLTGNLSHVVSFVDSPYVGDVEGWKYFAFEVYASGVPGATYTGFIEILSEDFVVNKLSLRVQVGWNPVPKINSVVLNDTSVLRVTETLGVTINVTDLDYRGRTTPPSQIIVNVYLLYFDPEFPLGWMIFDGPFSAEFNPATGLFEFSYTFPADYSLGMFGIGVEAIDPYYYDVRAMVRPFYVRNNIPIASATLSPRNIVGNETVLINVTASDIETMVEQLQLTASVVTPTGEEVPVRLTLMDGVFTATFNNTSEEGVYVFFVMVTDLDGASGVSIQYFEVDNTAPLVEILSPKNGSVVSGILNVTFIAWDAKLVNASLMIDNGMPIDVTGKTSFTLNTTELPDGPHTIRLTASDLAGNDAETSITIIVDNTPPLAVINAPINGAYVKGITGVNITGTDANFNRMELYINGILKQTWTESGIQTNDWNTHAYTDGSYTIKLVVYDEAGNMETAEITVTVDNTAPLAEIRAPLEGLYLYGTYNATIHGYDTNFDRMELYIGDTPAKNWTISGTQIYTWNTTTLGDGTYILKLTVFDKSGNTIEKTLTVIVDNTKPSVSITSPADKAELSGNITIAFNTSDTNLKSVFLVIDDSSYNVTGQTSFSWDTTKVGDGSFKVKLVASDEAGNIAETSITVTTLNVRLAVEAARNMYLAVGIPTGLIVGMAVAWAVFKRRRRLTPF